MVKCVFFAYHFWMAEERGIFVISTPPGSIAIPPTSKTDSPMDLWLWGLGNLPALALREF